MRELTAVLGPSDVDAVSRQLEQQLAGRTSPQVPTASAVAPAPRGPAGRRQRRRSAAASRQTLAGAVLKLCVAVGGILALSAYLQSLG